MLPAVEGLTPGTIGFIFACIKGEVGQT